ncbi:hypothetical protein DMC16_15090 [Lacticaseibacillus paracasei]|nr:hypothetical protein DMC16_15090 [Lacticaseibacillus paracasei]
MYSMASSVMVLYFLLEFSKHIKITANLSVIEKRFLIFERIHGFLVQNLCKINFKYIKAKKNKKPIYQH